MEMLQFSVERRMSTCVYGTQLPTEQKQLHYVCIRVHEISNMSVRMCSYVIGKGLWQVADYLAAQRPQVPGVKIMFWRCLFSDSRICKQLRQSQRCWYLRDVMVWRKSANAHHRIRFALCLSWIMIDDSIIWDGCCCKNKISSIYQQCHSRWFTFQPGAVVLEFCKACRSHWGCAAMIAPRRHRTKAGRNKWTRVLQNPPCSGYQQSMKEVPQKLLLILKQPL